MPLYLSSSGLKHVYSELPPTAERPPPIGFLWTAIWQVSPAMRMRTSPSSMRGRRRWSTSWPPASLPPLRYWPGKVDFHSPAPAPSDPSLQKTRNSLTVWYSTWLSFISMSFSQSSSPSDLSVSTERPSSDALSDLAGYSVKGIIELSSFLASQHSQMPSPAEPRFCLITRGWYAQHDLKPFSRFSAS